MTVGTHRSRLTLGRMALLLIALVVGCGSKEEKAPAGGGDDAAAREARLAAIRAQTQVAEGLSKAGQPAIDFQVVTHKGGTLALSELKGHVVLLDFWATYCRPCAKTIPMLIALQNKYSEQGLMVVGLSEEGDEKVAPFAQKMGINYTLAFSTPALVDAYDARGLPSLWLIDQNNRALKHYMGYSPESEQELEAQIQSLLAKK